MDRSRKTVRSEKELQVTIGCRDEVRMEGIRERTEGKKIAVVT